MVPVGGAIVAAPSNALVDKVSSLYPGRASMSPVPQPQKPLSKPSRLGPRA